MQASGYGAYAWDMQESACIAPSPGMMVRAAPPTPQIASEAFESKVVPLADGELPSVGSAGHEEGTCKRCAFFPKGRCKNGADCTHCHFDHPKQPRSRRRARRAFRHEDHQEAEEAEEEEMLDEHEDTAGEVLDQPLETAETLPHASLMACKKDDNLDDVSTQAGTALVTPSTLDEDTDYDALQAVPHSSDEVAHATQQSSGSGEDLHHEFDGEDSDTADEEHDQVISGEAPLGVVHQDADAPTATEDRKPAPLLVSAGSWAAKQRQRLMEKEKNGTLMPEFPAEETDKGAVRPSLSAPDAEIRGTIDADSSPVDAVPAVKAKHNAKTLQVSDSSWAAQQRLRRAVRETSSSSDMSAEEMGRKAKGLLNKLTEERFESLCQQVLDLPLETPEQLQALVAEIFDKATTERGFLSLYTELCARLDAHLVAQGSCVGGKVFRKALVTECQASFERNLHQPLDPTKLQHLSYEERYEEEVKHKTRTLGNMRFIGELLLRKLLAGKILFFIVNEMLDISNEASLESLTELLSIVSPVLEQKGTIHEAPLREVFGTMRMKSKDTKLSKRMRCKICDLLELRSRGWVAKPAIDTVPTKSTFEKTKTVGELAAARRR
jgi:translation initiation factor 4G